MSRHFVNYAFTTALYSEKRNFLETFSPFVLKALYDLDQIATDQQIYEYVRSSYDFSIPTNTIKSILNGLGKHSLVNVEGKSRGHWRGCINEKGRKEVEKFSESESAVARRQNKLIAAVKSYLKEHGFVKNEVEIEKLVLDYIRKNLTKLSIFNLDSSVENNHNGEPFGEIDYHLTGFIILIQERNPELYLIYEELIKGSIIREHIANSSEGEEFQNQETLAVYLDANFILSLLEFHHPTINIAARQLFDLLSKDNKIQIKVFSMTLEEIARLLTSYKYVKDNYNRSIPVNSIFYYLKLKKYDNIKTDNLIVNLDRKVSSIGIAVENYELRGRESFSREEEELYKDIYTYKNDQDSRRREGMRKEEEAIHLSALHDANIILAIKRKRGEWVRSLERAKAIFLTSSFLMDYFCKSRYRKEDRFPEVILDLTLTNILWLRNPNKEIKMHLHKLISAHSKRFIIDNGIWNRFVSTLKEMHGGGEITDEQFATVFSNNQLTIDYLQNVKIDDISPESILQLTQKVETEIKGKDEIIADKTAFIEQAHETLSEKIVEVVRLQAEKEGLEKRILESEERQQRIDREIERLKLDKKRNNYVDGKMDEKFYPLGNKLWSLLLGVLVALIFMYFAEIADDVDYQSLNVPAEWRKWIKFIGFLYPVIFAASNFGNILPIFRYRFDHSSLKRDYEKKFKDEFDNRELSVTLPNGNSRNT